MSEKQQVPNDGAFPHCFTTPPNLEGKRHECVSEGISSRVYLAGQALANLAGTDPEGNIERIAIMCLAHADMILLHQNTPLRIDGRNISIVRPSQQTKPVQPQIVGLDDKGDNE